MHIYVYVHTNGLKMHYSASILFFAGLNVYILDKSSVNLRYLNSSVFAVKFSVCVCVY